MRWLDILRLRSRSLFRRTRAESELDDELRFHLDQQIEENLASGMTRDEARHAAMRAIGGMTQIKEECRDMRGTNWFEEGVQDLRYGVRMLARSWGLTTIVVLTLALGVGVNTAVFSVLNGWLFRPLPVREPAQIVVLAAQYHDRPGAQFSYPNFLDLQTDRLSDVFAAGQPSFGGLSADHNAMQFGYNLVTSNYFAALGINPAAGRLLAPGESDITGESVRIVLGYTFWQKRFGGDRDIVDRQVLFNGAPATIIGVAQAGFHGTFFSANMDGYVSLSANPLAFWTDRGDRRLYTFGRLQNGVSLREAQASANVIAERIAHDHPTTDNGLAVRVIPEKLARPAPLVTGFVPIIEALFLFLAALVLAVAAMNVANIMAAQATARQQEMAVRASLGARRGRLIRQMMAEGLLLASLGVAAGVVLGKWTLGVAVVLLRSVGSSTSNIGLSVDTSFDWRVFAYAMAAALFTGILVAAWPAIRAGRANVNAMLHGGARGNRGGRGGAILGSLVVAQVAGSLILLVSAGLFIRSFERAEHMDLGFDPDHVLAVSLDTHAAGYDETRTKTFYRELEDHLGAIPGVSSTSMSFTVPMGAPSPGAPVYIEGREVSPDHPAPAVSFNAISPSYFETMRVPLPRGREFRESDAENARSVAIVNQAMARKLWGDEDPLGKRFSITGASGPFVEVIGLAANGQYWFVSPNPQPYFYVPIAQHSTSARVIEMRSSLPPESLAGTAEEQIRRLAPDLPVIDVRTMRETVEGLSGLFIFRLAAALAATMGILGLMLAMAGVFGLVAFSVGQRTHEIGVRVALGAGKREILLMVSNHAIRLVAAGIVVGLLTASTLSRTMSKLLVGVSATDLPTYAAIAILLVLVAAVSCWLPARRALRVDPVVALRSE